MQEIYSSLPKFIILKEYGLWKSRDFSLEELVI